MGTTTARSTTWRLRQVKRTDNQALIAEYRYNGLGYRLSWKYDTDGDTDVDGSDQTYFFVYDLKWRPVATYRGTDANPKERFIFHNAGLGGRGGSSYIDAVIMRDRDANAGWTAASDATLEERRYYCQNWRADVVALLESDGDVSEWVRYSAYGEATVYPFVNGDYNADGGVDGDDVTAFLTDQDNNVSAADVDRSGEVDGDDVTAFYASWDEGWMSTAWTSGGGLPSNAGQLSVTSGNRIGYAGYQFDPATEQYHVRHRVYSPEMGRWTRRDPIGYVNGMDLYEYVGSMPTKLRDGSGLAASGGCVGTEGVVSPPLRTVIDPWIGGYSSPRNPNRLSGCGAYWTDAVRLAYLRAVELCGAGPSIYCGICDSAGRPEGYEPEDPTTDPAIRDPSTCGVTGPGLRQPRTPGNVWAKCIRTPVVLVCVGRQGCGSATDTLIHELTHVAQMCSADPGCGAAGPRDCNQDICWELQAYAAEGRCQKDSQRNRCLCSNACKSSRTNGSCGSSMSETQCIARCIGLVAQGACSTATPAPWPAPFPLPNPPSSE